MIDADIRYFVSKDSIVREIWGKGDTIIFIFAGSAAEFAHNKAVDWLYFTGKLPADPLGRLFSTVTYAREIVFSESEHAFEAIDRIKAIHSAVENARKSTIPDWSYRDVLFMLIYYSIASFELLERKLKDAEKEEVFDVFYRVGERMELVGLPRTYQEWLIMREDHLAKHLERSWYTIDLYKQYKKHLGAIRYKMLKEGQILVMPERVRELLHFKTHSLLAPVIPVYKLTRLLKLDWFLKSLVLPKEYKQQVKDLDIYQSSNFE